MNLGGSACDARAPRNTQGEPAGVAAVVLVPDLRIGGQAREAVEQGILPGLPGSARDRLGCPQRKRAERLGVRLGRGADLALHEVRVLAAAADRVGSRKRVKKRASRGAIRLRRLEQEVVKEPAMHQEELSGTQVLRARRELLLDPVT